MNPQKIALLTDSCADIPPAALKKHPIYVLPLQIIFPDGAFADGVDITPDEVYRRIKTQAPKTSLPEGASVVQALEKIRADGYERVIAVMLSSGLSGTCNLVRLAAGHFSGLEIQVFDSLSGSLGCGITLLHLAELIACGRTWPQLLDILPRLMAGTRVFFCVNTLEYLRRGGRIGLISSVAGTMLQMKPILTFAPTGELTSIGKVRGRRQSLERLAQLVEEEYARRGGPCNLAVAHGGTPEDSAQVKKLLQKSIPGCRRFYEGVIDGTLGCYVGPGLVGAGIQFLDGDML